GAHVRVLAACGSFEFAVEDRKRLFEIVAVWPWASARRDQHIDQAIAAIGIAARQQDRIGISDQADVRQLLVLVRPRDRQLSLEIVGRNRRDRLGGDSVLVHEFIRPGCSLHGLISSGTSRFAWEFRPRACLIFSLAAAWSGVLFSL